MEILTTLDGIKYARRPEIGYLHDYVPGDLGENTVHGALKLLCDKNKVFVDVGAHVGLFTLKAARECKEVIAIEPNSVSAEGLRINIELNGFKNVKVLDYAIADEDGEKEFYCEDPSTASTLNPEQGIPRNIVWTKHVPVRMLDSVVKSADIVKIDIEGGEEKAIIGMKRLIRECKPTLIVEHHEYRGYFACEGMLGRIKDILNRYSRYTYRSFNLTGAHFLHIHKDTDIGRFVQTIVDYWTRKIVDNENKRIIWYHGLPGTFWWGASKDQFVRELLPTYAFDGKLEYQWYEAFNKL